MQADPRLNEPSIIGRIFPYLILYITLFELTAMAETVFDKIENACSKESFAKNWHWLIRLSVAGILVFHGVDKMKNGTPPQEMLDMMFLGSAGLFWFTAVLEFLAGLGIVAGGALAGNRGSAITRLSGLATAVVMLGAIFLVHMDNGWNFMNMGAEFQTLLAAVGLGFFMKGN